MGRTEFYIVRPRLEYVFCHLLFVGLRASLDFSFHVKMRIIRTLVQDVMKIKPLTWCLSDISYSVVGSF